MTAPHRSLALSPAAHARASGFTALIGDEVKAFVAVFSDDPKNLSQWGHHYFCDHDGGVLIFDLKKPHSHQCSVCGKVFTGELLDGTWWTMYRNEAIMTAWKCAYVYQATGTRDYLTYLQNIIGYYADDYLSFPLHDKGGRVYPSLTEANWGCGRIMPQGLNEAIILIRILNALELVKDALPESFLGAVVEKMFRPAYDLLRSQVTKIHNIDCWLNSAIGSMGLFSGDPEMIDFALNGEFNLRRQLIDGVTEDGFWYEGSIQYNYFTIEAALNFLLFAKQYGYDLPLEGQTIKKMLVSGYDFAFDNGQFPNPNDGWPNLNLKTFSFLYALAVYVFDGDDELASMLADILAGEYERGIIPLSKPYFAKDEVSLQQLIFAPEIEPASTQSGSRISKNYPASNCGILRSDHFNVFHKYGHQGRSHAHPDKMNIEVIVNGMSLSRDLSNSGYGARLCDQWHRVSASHNTIVVDGSDHHSVGPGEAISFSTTALKSRAREVYPGVDFFRSIRIEGEELFDQFCVDARETHILDCFFHVEAELQADVDGFTPATLGFADHGYQHLADIRLVAAGPQIAVLEWQLGNTALASSFELTAGQQLFISRTYDNPASSFRTSLIIRQQTDRAEFRMTWRTIN